MSGNFVVYLIGYIIVIIGVAYGLSAAGVGTEWIVPVVLIMAGLGIVYALSRSQRDKQADRGSQAPQQTTQVQSPPKDDDRETQSSRTASSEAKTSEAKESGRPSP